ncbi:hypothetical protein AB0L71_32375 [Streptomyces sp. NPDC052052]|uniref:hypothetical protein n=1 Tax=Streptomyces sp. NPDC052052 TaxID=3154756 RepID=UPI0034380A45
MDAAAARATHLTRGDWNNLAVGELRLTGAKDIAAGLRHGARHARRPLALPDLA